MTKLKSTKRSKLEIVNATPENPGEQPNAVVTAPVSAPPPTVPESFVEATAELGEDSPLFTDPITRAFQAREAYCRYQEEAIELLLAQRREIDDKLAALDYTIPRVISLSRSVTAQGGGRERSDRVCKICHQPGHDARRHRYSTTIPETVTDVTST